MNSARISTENGAEAHQDVSGGSILSGPVCEQGLTPGGHHKMSHVLQARKNVTLEAWGDEWEPPKSSDPQNLWVYHLTR